VDSGRAGRAGPRDGHRHGEVGGERRLAFGRDARGRVEHLFWGPVAYLRVPWYQAPPLQLALLAASLAVLASSLVAWPVHAWVARRRGDPPSPGGARVARWWAALLALLSLALVAGFFVLTLGFAETYVYPTWQVAALTRLFWLVPGATLGTAALAMVAWRRRYWSPAWRAHYGLVAGAAFLLVGWLGFWNLLAWP
jgi:hypothetical protein